MVAELAFLGGIRRRQCTLRGREALEGSVSGARGASSALCPQGSHSQGASRKLLCRSTETLKEGPLPVAAASAQALPAGLPQRRPLTFQLLPEFLLDEPPQGVQGWRLPLGGREVGVSCLPSTSCHPRPSRAQETKGVMGNTHCILLV